MNGRRVIVTTKPTTAVVGGGGGGAVVAVVIAVGVRTLVRMIKMRMRIIAIMAIVATKL